MLITQIDVIKLQTLYVKRLKGCNSMSGSFCVTYEGTSYFEVCQSIEQTQKVNAGKKELKIVTHWPSNNVALTFGKKFSNRMKSLKKENME